MLFSGFLIGFLFGCFIADYMIKKKEDKEDL